MERKSFTTKSIALMGLLMGLQIILTRFLSIQTPLVRIGFTFIAVALMGLMFSPLIAGLGNALADFIGITLFPVTGGFFPGFSVSAFMTAAIYSVFFYKKEMTLKRIIIANVIVTLVVDLVMNTFWLYLMLGPGSLAGFPLRVLKSAVLLVIQVIGTYWLVNVPVLQKQLLRFAA
ncbi:MAG: folate family ECF transporter S component [Vagococcus sp.]